MRNHGIRYRRTLAVALALCTSAFVGLVGTTAAQAAPPTDHQNFYPNDTDGLTDGTDTLVPEEYLSDREDGQGETAHLSAVATTDTVVVRWYHCPAGIAGADGTAGSGDPAAGDAVTQADVNSCAFIDEDTTPTTPEPPTSSTGLPVVIVDEAYEIFWGIPTSLDDDVRDILTLACTVTPTAGAEISGGNCRSEAEDDVYLEDAQTGTSPQSGAAEWDQVCYQISNCEPTTAGSQNFDFIHGMSWPNVLTGAMDETEASATASADIDGLSGSIFATVDAVTEYAGGAADESVEDLSADVTTSLFKVFDDFEFSSYPDNDEMSVILSDADLFAYDADPTCKSAADNNLECVFDAHYVVSRALNVAQAHIHNDADPATPGDQAGASPNQQTCNEQNRTKTGEIETDEADEVIGCLFSNFTEFEDIDGDGDMEKNNDHLLDAPGTFEITSNNATFAATTAPAPVITATASCEGTAHDHDANGLSEHCHVTNMGGDDKAEGVLVAVTGGAINVDFCSDPDAGLPENTTNAAHGCGDEAASLRDTASKNSTPIVDHNHLRLSSEATGNCHAGTASHTAQAGTAVNLTGCAQDAFHNGAPDTRVIWRIAANPNDPAQFVGVPEQRTDSTGKADAAVTSSANSGGLFSNILFCGDGDEDGVCDTIEAQFQISWTQAPGGGGGACNKIRGSNRNDKLRGTGGDDCIKGRRGDDRLRGRAGNDLLVGGPGFDRCFGGPGADRFRGCEVKRG